MKLSIDLEYDCGYYVDTLGIAICYHMLDRYFDIPGDDGLPTHKITLVISDENFKFIKDYRVKLLSKGQYQDNLQLRCSDGSSEYAYLTRLTRSILVRNLGLKVNHWYSVRVYTYED